MRTIARKLISHWEASSISISIGVAEGQIREFEHRYHVVMPLDIREYFLQVDGMQMTLNDCKDKEGFSFWPLRRVKTVKEELNRSAGKYTEAKGAESFFVFADYLDWSWAYAIYLSDDLSTRNKVVLIGKGLPIEIADSFTDFVNLYLSDSPKLYGGNE